MKRIAKVSMMIFGAAIFLFLMFSTSYAQGQMKPKETAKPSEKIKPDAVKLSIVDLKIDNIYTGSACPCPELDRVDALYLDKISVFVSNVGNVSTGGTIKVTFFSYPTCQLMTMTTTVPNLNPSEHREYIVVQGPLLVRKSTGVKAEIRLSGGAADANPANNVMTIYKCNLRPVD
jgi:hypothetical protein